MWISIRINEVYLIDSIIILARRKTIFLRCYETTSWRENPHIALYSIPQFVFTSISYTEDYSPPLSTVSSHFQQHIFFPRAISCLFLDFNKTIIQSIYRFTYFHQLHLAGITLPSVNTLMSIVDCIIKLKNSISQVFRIYSLAAFIAYLNIFLI